MRLAIVALVLAAAFPSSSAGPAAGKRLVDDPALAQIGADANMVIAIDLASMDRQKLLDQLPDRPPCLREVLGSVKRVVIAIGTSSSGRVTGAARDTTRTCVSAFAPLLGITVKETATGFDVETPDGAFSVTWERDTATIVERGNAAPKGKPAREIAALFARVPADAKGLLAQFDEPKHKIKSDVAWLQTRDDAFVVTWRFEGTKAGYAHDAVTDMVSGFKEGAKQKGITVDDAWFKIRDDGMISTFVATVPYTAFAHH